MTRVTPILADQLREEAAEIRGDIMRPGRTRAITGIAARRVAQLLEDAAERIDEQEAEILELREMIRD